MQIQQRRVQAIYTEKYFTLRLTITKKTPSDVSEENPHPPLSLSTCVEAARAGFNLVIPFLIL